MRILVLLLLAACSDGNSVPPAADLAVISDLATLQAGAICEDLTGTHGTCAAGLKCCFFPCDMAAGTCMDNGAQCVTQPAPPGYYDCH
jgi:hypothetical protein